MSDHIPQGDAEFDTFQRNFVSKVVANPARYGLTAADASTLQSDQAPWTTGYPTHTQAQATAHAATAAKDGAKHKLSEDMRSCLHKAKGANISDAARSELGLKAADQAHTPIGPPATRPVGRIEVHGRATLVLHFADETTPGKRAKPHGVHGAEIWSALGSPPPADPGAYRFLGLDTRSPYIDEHEPADAGKDVYYLLRWQNEKGEHGPWSDVVAAKVPV